MRHRIAVFIIDQDRVLLIHRIKNGQKYYAVPGGGQKPGETEEQTAVREIKEETSFDIVLGGKIGSLVEDDSAQSFYVASSFSGKLALGGPEVRRQSADNVYQLEWVPVARLDQITLRKEIRDILLKYLQEA